jgi:Mg/Co/Ni transporter MgtE
VDQTQQLIGLVSFDDVLALLGMEVGNLAATVASTGRADTSQNQAAESAQPG